jgi:hypothetical protein
MTWNIASQASIFERKAFPENTEIVDIATTDMIMLIFYILYYIF